MFIYVCAQQYYLQIFNSLKHINTILSNISITVSPTVMAYTYVATYVAMHVCICAL